MSDARQSTDRLAALVADGTPVDWEDALRSAPGEDEKRIIHHLRIVEGVSRVHRSAGSAIPEVQDSLTMTEAGGAPRRFAPLPANATWAHLELREQLGEGAFGEVYRAWDPRLKREVALKLLKSSAPKVVDEGRLLAKLRCPNVVAVYGAEAHDGRVGLWMEFIRGRTLEQLLEDQGPFGAREAALIGIELCRALAAVHRAGVIHRDVKAQNAMREEGGRILLTDFGAGVDLRVDSGEKASSISGTPFYMASELFRGQPATQRSDIYSLGVLLFRLVTGSFPVEARTWDELRGRHDRHEAKLLRDLRPDLSESFVKTVERAMEWDPAERFATAGQLEQSLSYALGMENGPIGPTSEPAPPRRRGFHVHLRWRTLQWSIAGAIVLAGVALLNAYRLTQTLEPPLTGKPPVASPAESPRKSPAYTATYTVEAALFRVAEASGERERLEPGSQLSLGDKLTLEFKASAPLHVYIIDEDDAGHAYALFPLPGLQQSNPFPPGATHVLPGSRDGKELAWVVDSPGGREHLMVLASPTRLVEFEAEMNGLALPGQTAVAIPESARVQLRGIGGVAEVPASNHSRTAGNLFEMAQRLAGHSEVVTGVWLRRIEFENPKPN